MGVNSTTTTGNFLCEKYFFCSNLYDGGFLLSKIITEFGIIGIIFSFVILVYIFLSFLRLRFIITKTALNIFKFTPREILMNAVIYSFIIELLFRGYGYFSTGFIMLIYCLFNNKINLRYDKKNA